MNSLQPEQMLGPYQIISQIGKGGMATVYKAYHASMDRYVALKVVAVGLTDDPNFLKRFQQEARLIAKLEHPHILPVYDFGESEAIPYMVMRFLEAGTLKERLASEPLPIAEIDRIFNQLADALQYAHENGVIHRDIKPSNAMLDKRGDVFLTDFGVAKMLEGSSGLTATGTVTGTPAYMSPEQAMGNKADPRSDIYSLGVVLFEMLTGRVPFEAETPMAVLFKQIQEPPPPLSIVRPDLPYTLEAVLLKALAKDPADRYASMDAFRDSWKNAVDEASEPTPVSLPAVKTKETTLPGATVKNPASETVKPTPAPRKGLPGWVWGLGLGIFFILLVAAGGIFTVQRILLQGNQTQPNPQSTPNEITISPVLPESGNVDTPVKSGYTATSWAAANTYYTIAVLKNQLLAGGPGGISIFDLEDPESYQQFTTASGLPGATVNSIFITSDETIWIGTDGGLLGIKDDKHQLFNTENGLDSDYVSAIASDGKTIYIGTQYSALDGGGLLQLNGDNIQPVAGFPSQYDPDSEHVLNNINSILIDENEYLWVATNNGIAMRDDELEWNVFTTENGLPDNIAYSLYQDYAGNILAGTSSSYVASFNWDTWQFEPLFELGEFGIYDVRNILQDDDENYWFSGYGIVRYNPSDESWKAYNSNSASLSIQNITTMAKSDDGTIFLGSEDEGIAAYTGQEFIVAYQPNRPRFASYRQIIPSPSDTLIFSQLYSNGSDQYNLIDETWSSLPVGNYEPLVYDSQGNLWSGEFDGLWIFSPEKTTHLTTSHGLPSDTVRVAVFDSGGTAYIGTELGIAVFDGKNITSVYDRKNTGWDTDDFNKLFIDSGGTLWAASGTEISRLLPSGEWEIYNTPEIFGGYLEAIHDFAEDSQGNIWVATHGDGLYQFTNDTWMRYLSTDPGVELPNDYIASLAIAPDGALWIGTFDGGLARFDGVNWQRFGLEDGLIHLSILDIYIEKNGAVWLATEGGITRLQP